MQFKQIKNKVKRNKNSKEKDLLDNKIITHPESKETIEFKKVCIVNPKINIANRQLYIIEPLKTELSLFRKEKNNKEINNDKNILNSNINVKDGFKDKKKIKVKLKSHKNLPSNFEKNIKTIRYKIKKISPGKKNKNNMIFKYSSMNNLLSKSNEKFKSNSDIFDYIKKDFETPKNISYNQNLSYKNNLKKNYEERIKLLTKTNNSKDKGKKVIDRYNDLQKENSLCKDRKFHKKKFKQSLNLMAFNKINNLRINDLSNISQENTERYGNKSYLHRKKYIKNSNSFKSPTKDIIENSKLKLFKNYLRNNDDFENSLFSSKYNLIQNTYQKKLVKRHFIKIDNNYPSFHNLKLDNSTIQGKEKINNKRFGRFIFDNYNSHKNNKSSNHFLKGIANERINEKTQNNIIMSNKIISKINGETLYNNYFYNREKDETNYQTEQKINSGYDNYYTSNSFQQNPNNNINNLANIKLLTTAKIGRKLKNIITSIDCKNNENDSISKSNKKKNIILYELDKNGKINYKIREMKNSVEKIMNQKSNSKIKKGNKNIEASPKNIKEAFFTLYVKKNQGTVLRKNKHKNKFEFYNPSLNNEEE